MRITFITVGDTSRRVGGHIFNARICKELRALGDSVTEVVASGASPEEQREAAEGLGARVAAVPADVVVVDALARIVCAPWLDRWRVARPLVALVHELASVAALDRAAAERDRAVEAPLLRADRLIAVSCNGRAILEAHGVPAARIRVVQPGSDRPRPVTGGTLTRIVGSQAGERPLQALCVAQWIPRKGIDTLIAAWSLLKPARAILRLIGETDADPVYAMMVRAAIAEADETSIVVSSSVDADTLESAYAAADLFVLPSRYEGYGSVYAEALLRGLPIIAGNAGAIPELVKLDAGILVPPDDPVALAAALDRLLRDAALRTRLAEGSRRRGARIPDWDKTVRGVRAVLDEAIAMRR